MLKNCVSKNARGPLWTLFRSSSTNPNASKCDDSHINRQQNHQKMKGWQIHEYGDVDVLQLNKNIKIPVVNDPNEVLIEVESASVNPIDVAMISMLME